DPGSKKIGKRDGEVIETLFISDCEFGTETNLSGGICRREPWCRCLGLLILRNGPELVRPFVAQSLVENAHLDKAQKEIRVLWLNTDPLMCRGSWTAVARRQDVSEAKRLVVSTPKDLFAVVEHMLSDPESKYKLREQRLRWSAGEPVKERNLRFGAFLNTELGMTEKAGRGLQMSSNTQRRRHRHRSVSPAAEAKQNQPINTSME
ncbi:unnamed protein product, partial [Brassica napus]